MIENEYDYLRKIWKWGKEDERIMDLGVFVIVELCQRLQMILICINYYVLCVLKIYQGEDLVWVLNNIYQELGGFISIRLENFEVQFI